MIDARNIKLFKTLCNDFQNEKITEEQFKEKWKKETNEDICLKSLE